MPQGRGDLGRRMQRIFDCRHAGPVLIAGTDVPGIRPAQIAEAFRLLGRHWYPLECPRHIVVYTPDAVKPLLAKAGFATVDCYSEVLTKDTASGHVPLNLANVSMLYRIASLARSLGLAVNDALRLMGITDVVPLLEAPKGMDLPGYCEDILKRFHNPAIKHLLSQIAWDGSQKLPIRILSSLSEALAQGHDISRLCVPLAARRCAA